jgi:hypothetical protein
MTFYFDDETGVMRITFATEANGPSVYIETPTGIFRIERSTNRLLSITIPAFNQKIACGELSLLDLTSTVVPNEVLLKLRSR